MADKKPDVFMPLYIGDYLAGTGRLTTELHGAYLLLIMDYWMNGPPPDDDSVLASITKMNADAWSMARAMLVHYFNICDGKWMHGRIEEELEKASLKKQKSREKAEKAALARWGNASSNATSITQALHDECPSPSPSQLVPNGTNKSIETPRKSQSFKNFFTAYPANKKGGRDASAWKKAKSLKLTDQDFDAMVADLERREGLMPKWFSTYAPGICKYLDDHIWKTPVIPETALHENTSGYSQSHQNPRRLTPGERVLLAHQQAIDRERASGPPDLAVVAVHE